MTAKEYLSRIRSIDFQIRCKEKQLEDARDLQGSVRAFDYSGVKVKTSPHGDANINLALDIMALEKDLAEKKYELQKAKAKLIEEIGGLDNEIHVELLTLRYCDLAPFEAIALDMHMSYDRIRHLHGEALRSFQNKYLVSAS